MPTITKPMNITPRLVGRVMAKVVKTDSNCWEWQGRVRANGYAQISQNGTYYFVHRVIWCARHSVANTPIGTELDHLCRNKLCVNPCHLEPVTHEENMVRVLGEQTHCKEGHLFTPDVTYYWVRPNGNIGKRCRLCRTFKRYAKQAAQFEDNARRFGPVSMRLNLL